MRLRDQLVSTTLEWQARYGIAPSITSAVSEYDAAVTLVGMTEDEFGTAQRHATAVQRGYDFLHEGIRYQVKANRPSGKPGSRVTLCPKARNYDWDRLIWILYNVSYQIEEAWMWEVKPYRDAFHTVIRLAPAHMRQGTRLQPKFDAVPALWQN